MFQKIRMSDRLTFFVLFCVFIVLTDCQSSIAYEEEDDNTCTNDDNTKGICTVIEKCPPAIQSLKVRRRHFFSRCGFEGSSEIVCCPTVQLREPETETEVRNTFSKVRQACLEYSNEVKSGVEYHILEGEDAHEGDFPHMVALGYEDDKGISYDCGGSLISKRYLVTAAHCIINNKRVRPTKARLGVIRLDDNSDKNAAQDFDIENITIHPNYNVRSKLNDIALVKLNGDVKNSEYVYPACLHTQEKLPARLTLIISGWGTIRADQQLRANILQRAYVQEVSLTYCNETYQNRSNKPILTTQICAYDNKSDACEGDSGGPLQYLSPDAKGVYTIVGITSYGLGCGVHPGIYTRIYSYVDWIEKIVWN